MIYVFCLKVMVWPSWRLLDKVKGEKRIGHKPPSQIGHSTYDIGYRKYPFSPLLQQQLITLLCREAKITDICSLADSDKGTATTSAFERACGLYAFSVLMAQPDWVWSGCTTDEHSAYDIRSADLLHTLCLYLQMVRSRR